MEGGGRWRRAEDGGGGQQRTVISGESLFAVVVAAVLAVAAREDCDCSSSPKPCEKRSWCIRELKTNTGLAPILTQLHSATRRVECGPPPLADVGTLRRPFHAFIPGSGSRSAMLRRVDCLRRQALLQVGVPACASDRCPPRGLSSPLPVQCRFVCSGCGRAPHALNHRPNGYHDGPRKDTEDRPIGAIAIGHPSRAEACCVPRPRQTGSICTVNPGANRSRCCRRRQEEAETRFHQKSQCLVDVAAALLGVFWHLHLPLHHRLYPVCPRPGLALSGLAPVHPRMYIWDVPCDATGLSWNARRKEPVFHRLPSPFVFFPPRIDACSLNVAGGQQRLCKRRTEQ